jgi:DNA (cytosine-5)-methyltransferase 1
LIANHIAASMSDLDLEIARAVPAGGNWKNIPTTVASQRISQIRLSFARGEGSRSTYYGRLKPDSPSYTISTYFTRPGNGCHLHYDEGQDRTLSYREAARLQSFPDSFKFIGSNASVAKQIGNAVPPLLAFALAKGFGEVTGQTLDLFSGAGGLALGFTWAGWKSLVANDIDVNALKTFRENVHSRIVPGDIRLPQVKKELVGFVASERQMGVPFVILGGPPCQGFSTAGNKRSRDDDRNSLFRDYCEIVDALKPSAFLFENVTGLMNIEGGAIFKEISAELGRHCDRLLTFQLSADSYGVPQKRKRVILLGLRFPTQFSVPLGPTQGGLLGIDPVTVVEALNDLPPLSAGQDGTCLPYRFEALSPYQRFMRGEMLPLEYFDLLSENPQSSNSVEPAISVRT